MSAGTATMDAAPNTSWRRWFVAINLAFGPLVPLSYVWSAKRWPDHVGALWGALPEAWQLPYTGNMFFAAAGYLVFTWFIFKHGEQAMGRLGVGKGCLAYLAILIPSMLWMPLTLHALATSSPLEWLIQLVLALVALGSLALAYGVFTSPAKTALRRWAQAGALFFCAQTVLLDAILWPRFFAV